MHIYWKQNRCVRVREPAKITFVFFSFSIHSLLVLFHFGTDLCLCMCACASGDGNVSGRRLSCVRYALFRCFFFRSFLLWLLCFITIVGIYACSTSYSGPTGRSKKLLCCALQLIACISQININTRKNAARQISNDREQQKSVCGRGTWMNRSFACIAHRMWKCIFRKQKQRKTRRKNCMLFSCQNDLKKNRHTQWLTLIMYTNSHT